MIQASSAWCIRGSQAHCFDSWKGHPDTETLADYIAERFKGHDIYVYPDPTGNARKSSAPVGQTDFSILRSRGLKVLARQKSPSIVDSVAAVNRRLKSAAGDIEVYVDPKARDVVESLEKTSWVDKNPDLAAIDKTEGIEHHSDGVRYFFEYRWPIRNSSSRVAQGDSF